MPNIQKKCVMILIKRVLDYLVNLPKNLSKILL